MWNEFIWRPLRKAPGANCTLATLLALVSQKNVEIEEYIHIKHEFPYPLRGLQQNVMYVALKMRICLSIVPDFSDDTAAVKKEGVCFKKVYEQSWQFFVINASQDLLVLIRPLFGFYVIGSLGRTHVRVGLRLERQRKTFIARVQVKYESVQSFFHYKLF